MSALTLLSGASSPKAIVETSHNNILPSVPRESKL